MPPQEETEIVNKPRESHYLNTSVLIEASRLSEAPFPSEMIDMFENVEKAVHAVCRTENDAVKAAAFQNVLLGIIAYTLSNKPEVVDATE